MTDNLQKFSKIMEAMSKEFVAPEDFVKSFAEIMKVFLAMKESNQKQMAEMKATHAQMVSEMEYMTGDKMTEMKDKVMNYCKQIMDKIQKQNENELNFIRDKINNLKIPSENEITKNVLAKIPPIPPPPTAIETRDQLETLRDEEKLSGKAIKGWDELEKQVKEKTSNQYHLFSGTKQLTGSKFSFNGDDITTTFYLPKAVAGKGLFIFAHYQGQWLQNGVHYTVSGKTFNTSAGTSPFTAATGTVIEGFLINF